jgi:hypothetical protein
MKHKIAKPFHSVHDGISKIRCHLTINLISETKKYSMDITVYTLSFILLDIVGGEPSSFISKSSLPPTTFLSLCYGDYVTLLEAQLKVYTTHYSPSSK